MPTEVQYLQLHPWRKSVMLRKYSLLLLLACFSVLFCTQLSSQTVEGTISGTVTDPSGAVVPGATITLTNTGTGIAQSTTTGAAGEYRFSLVPPGTYTIGIKATGFAEERASGLVVQASQTVPFSFKLKVATAQQLVEVTGQNPLVQTET